MKYNVRGYYLNQTMVYYIPNNNNSCKLAINKLVLNTSLNGPQSQSVSRPQFVGLKNSTVCYRLRKSDFLRRTLDSDVFKVGRRKAVTPIATSFPIAEQTSRSHRAHPVVSSHVATGQQTVTRERGAAVQYSPIVDYQYPAGS